MSKALISSTQNEKIKNIVKLRETSRERKKQGRFVVEGAREINLAIAGGVEVENLYYCAAYGRNKPDMAEEKIIELAEKVFKKISYRENPDGLLAVAKIKELKLDDIKLRAKPLIIILEAVEKPGNLGAMLRTADAAGVDAVIINDVKSDIYNSNVIRASQGAVFSVPVAGASAAAALKFCKKNKIKICAAAPAGGLEYTKADYRGSSAILLGAEDKGLSEFWLKAADEQIKITMRGRADSLNVSASAAVILFEAVRQRNK